jgi:hypothetical protein
MRHAAAFILMSMSLALPAMAARLESARGAEPDATVVLNFKGTYSPAAIAEMQRESAHILQAAGIRLGWTTRAEAAGRSFADLVVLNFSGACMFQPAPPRYDETGPYASTITTNGVVQPFGTVDCDHVANSARGAMTGVDFNHADQLVGRALGRVVAHELVHMLSRSEQHGHEGVETAGLTAKQLIGSSLPLSREDADRLRLELKSR